jgi:hypothetical protein
MAHDKRLPANISSPHSHASFFIALVLTLIFGGLFLCGFEPHYAGIMSYGGNSDEVRATMFVSGVCVPGGPSEKLLYSNQLIGRGLAGLYTAQPSVPWYGIYLIASHLLAHFIICYSLFRMARDVRTRVAAVLFVFVFGSHIWIALNFTRIACFVAIAGISLNASAVMEEAASERRTPFYARVIFGWCLVMYAGMIRWQAAQLMGLVLAPVMVCLACLCWKKVKATRHLVIAAVAILAMFCAESWSQQQLASQRDWKAFKEFERPMANLINNRHVQSLLYDEDELDEETAEVLGSVGWSHNDAKVFDFWLFLDEKVFSTRNVAYVDRNLTSYSPSRDDWKRA